MTGSCRALWAKVKTSSLSEMGIVGGFLSTVRVSVVHHPNL